MSRFQDVADEAQRVDDVSCTAGAQLPAQHVDVYLNIFGAGGGIRPPDALEDDLFCQNMARVSGQQLEQSVLPFAEFEQLPVAPYFMRSGIKHQVSNLKVLAFMASGPDIAQPGADTFGQFIFRQWPGNNAIGPTFKPGERLA